MSDRNSSGFDPDYYVKKKEEIYSGIRLTVKQMDIIIIVLIILLIAAFTIGSLKGNGRL